MSYEDDLYSQTDDMSDDTNLVKKLRSKIDELAAKAKELESENQTLRGSARKQTLSSALTARGYPAKIAAFIPSDVEPTDEALDQWLSEFGDVFGGGQAAPQEGIQQAPVVVGSAADADAYRRMAVAEAGGTPPANVSGDILSQINSAESLDDLMAVLRGA